VRKGKVEKLGYRVGQDWAGKRATKRQLKRLAGFELLRYIDPLAVVVARTMDPALDVRDAWGFWENELGDNSELAEDDLFVRGFVDGACDVWEKVATNA
jgi:hypothetical protein